MQISDETIEEYIQIYEEDFGKKLSVAEAREIITRVVILYEVLYRPLPGELVRNKSVDGNSMGQ